MKTLSHKVIDLTPERMRNRTFRERPDCPRSKGIHVQAVNNYLATAAGKLKEDTTGAFPAFSDTFYPLLPAMGVAWEDFWSTLFTETELLWQPGEMERGDIYGTPDGIMLESGAVGECKFTLSKRKPISECWRYLRQGMSYCALGGFNLVEYHINWMLGDYMRPYQPVYDVTLVEFSNDEIETWYSRMQAVKEKVKPE